jgi:hypothetical protein
MAGAPGRVPARAGAAVPPPVRRVRLTAIRGGPAVAAPQQGRPRLIPRPGHAAADRPVGHRWPPQAVVSHERAVGRQRLGVDELARPSSRAAAGPSRHPTGHFLADFADSACRGGVEAWVDPPNASDRAPLSRADAPPAVGPVPRPRSAESSRSRSASPSPGSRRSGPCRRGKANAPPPPTRLVARGSSRRC